ncbi:Eco29kI family restriction endonuclease [[Clostridium] aminophilum]|uniref:Eco29kI restriction endonuclease n=1 Tax=[Clostridium] aminophilum TaxID=1526 RepID=A0A1I6JJ71_9FIRM|nr:Eco29kI family restriction endonuclease [[Clostridium] aminophilum]SFR78949.1 Eco29kI restriction endonuclease [[Clostridium] aminophilum]
MAADKNIPIIEPYNPLDKENIGNSIANVLMSNEKQKLPPEPFIGAGVYAIFYVGDNSLYKPLAEYNQDHDCMYPIYVGKAVPQGARKGGIGLGENQGPALQKRLGDHAKSITEVNDLNIDDFFCRFIVVDDIWIPLAESLMISRYKPVWNSIIDGFGNHDPGSGRKGQVQSPWDMLHPGRSWAKKLPAGPKSQSELSRLVAYYFKTNEILQRKGK